MINFMPIDMNIVLDKQEIIDNFEKTTDYWYWSFEKLTHTKNGKYGKNDFTDRARKKYPKLIEYISHLPYTHISNVKINFQTAAVKAHIDFQPENQHLARMADKKFDPNEGIDLYKDSLNYEPCGYRIVVRGSNDALKLHINDEIKTCLMPDDTPTYVINHTSALHSVDRDEGRINVYVSGFIDREKHMNILDRSMKKYKKYIL